MRGVLGVLLAAWLPLAGTAGCAPTGPAAVDASEAVRDSRPTRAQALVWLDFDDPPGPAGSVLGGMTSTGTAPVDVAMLTLRGGRVRRTEGLDATAARLPGWRRGRAVAAAVAVRTRSTATVDPLQLGASDFEVGADFRLDARSDGAPHDDGDNLLQRGLFSDDSQVKVQVDRGVPSCRVAGDAGELVATTGVAVERGAWYRLRCVREGQSLTIRLSALVRPAAGGPPVELDLEHGTVTGDVGELSWPTRTPLTVGAKATADGGLVRSETDQFNGAVDDVYLALLPRETR